MSFSFLREINMVYSERSDLMDTIKKIIGFSIAIIGAKLWEKNGYYTTDSYEDLNVLGKFGFRMLRRGIALIGLGDDELEKIANSDH